MKKRITFIAVLLAMATVLFTGCSKENKYVNVGVLRSTDGLSLCLTGFANSDLPKVSEYVFFSDGIDMTLEKITEKKMNIDAAYILAEDLGRIKADMGLCVIAVDCFDTDGSLKGVWIARNNWLMDAPTYSRRFVTGLLNCMDFRADHLIKSYAEAYSEVKASDKDPDVEGCGDVNMYCAIYSLSNDEPVADHTYVALGRDEIAEMFEGFENGTGKGYEVCRDAYDRYCAGSDISFDDLFDLDLMFEELEENDK